MHPCIWGWLWAWRALISGDTGERGEIWGLSGWSGRTVTMVSEDERVVDGHCELVCTGLTGERSEVQDKGYREMSIPYPLCATCIVIYPRHSRMQPASFVSDRSHPPPRGSLTRLSTSLVCRT